LVEARIGLAVPGRPIGPWPRRTGAPQASATGRDRSELCSWCPWSALGPCGIGNRWSSAGMGGHDRLRRSAGQRTFTSGPRQAQRAAGGFSPPSHTTPERERRASTSFRRSMLLGWLVNEGVRNAHCASAQAWWCPRSTAACCGDVGWPRPANTGVPDRDRRTEDRRTDAKRAHNRDQASLPAPRPPTRNSGHLPVVRAGHVSRAPDRRA
jgi:hypothetical protein